MVKEDTAHQETANWKGKNAVTSWEATPAGARESSLREDVPGHRHAGKDRCDAETTPTPTTRCSSVLRYPALHWINLLGYCWPH